MSSFKIISVRVLVCILLACGIHTSAAITFVTQPYLQHLTPNEVTIMWTVDKNANYSWVMYGEGSQLNIKANDTIKGLIQAYSRINRITLKNLQPGTSYSYSVFSKEITATTNSSVSFGATIQSDTYTFTTPGLADTKTAAVIFNDTHNDSEIITKLLRLNEIPDYDFVFFNGDILDGIPDENAIVQNFINPCVSVFASTKPLMTVRGEGETRNQFARNYFDYFQMGENNQGYYSFTRGPVFYIVLDSGEDKQDNDATYSGLNAFEVYRQEQALWLKVQMESDAYKKALYRVVFMHLPTFINDGIETFSIQQCRQLFNPLFNDYNISALISGYTHKAGILLPNENHKYPIIIGGGFEKTTEQSDYNATIITLTADEQLFDVKVYDYGGTKVAEYNNPQTAAFNPKESTNHIYLKNNNLYIETTKVTTVEIYTALGVKIKTCTLHLGTNEIGSLAGNKILLLKIGTQVYKLVSN